MAEPFVQIFDNFLFNSLWKLTSIWTEAMHCVFPIAVCPNCMLKWQRPGPVGRNRSLQSSAVVTFFNLNWSDVQFFMETLGGKFVMKDHDSTGDLNHIRLCSHKSGSCCTSSSSVRPAGILLMMSAMKGQPLFLFLLFWLKK